MSTFEAAERISTGPAPDTGTPTKVPVLDVHISATSYAEATILFERWVGEKSSRYICVCNVHSVMTARKNSLLRQAINDADIATSDGMPLVWALRLLGRKKQSRVYGPTLMLHLCESAARNGFGVYLYGGTLEALERLERNLAKRFPGLNIVGAYSPPFQPLAEEEEREAISRQEPCSRIASAGADIVFVGLGCPKQELWMARHARALPTVMVGVGAAFDFHAGTVPQAPPWMQKAGLEWLFRIYAEPRRLWRRYIWNNPLYLILLVGQLMRQRCFGGSS